jgi:hypothetical protein
MTAETTRPPVRAPGFRQRMVGRWYKKLGVSEELARVHDAVEDALGDALEAWQEELGLARPGRD